MENIDFQRCFLCQSTNTNDLKDPKSARIKNREEHKPYKTLAQNILELYNLDEFPFAINIEKLDSHEGGLEAVLTRNGALFHKLCRNRIDNQKVERARKRKQVEHVSSPVKTRRCSILNSSSASLDGDICDSQSAAEKSELCFLCDQPASNELKKLHKVATFGIDEKVRRCAMKLCDTELLRKISNGDMVAQDCFYHLACLAKLYRRANIDQPEDYENENTKILCSQALAELIDYVENFRNTNTTFQMSELYHLYLARLGSLGINNQYIHRTRLRQSLLSAIPDLKEIKNTAGSFELAFDCDLSMALLEITSQDSNSDVFLLSQAAKILRKRILQQKQYFTGSFSDKSEVQSVPTLLLTFMQMLIDGPKINTNQTSNNNLSAAVLSLSQLVSFNTVKERSNQPENVPRHVRDRETPLAIYIAIKIHATTRKESLVNTFHERGLCISYSRLRSLSTDLANSVIAYYEHAGVVVPPQAKPGRFMTCGLDNIDHNPRSTTCRSSLHGTICTIVQFPNEHQANEENETLILNRNVMGKKLWETCLHHTQL